MTLSAGRTVWIPCEVKPGPFSNERLVRVEGDPQSWVGFVPIWYLRDAIERGRTEVRAVVAEMRGEQFLARIPGHALGSPVVLEPIERATPLVGTN
jgi:hypothetical protein